MGLIYALIAFGFQITYSTSKTANFGQGALVMLGGFVSAWLTPKFGYWLALPAAIAICAAAGLLIERVAVAPALRRGTNAWVVATMALGIMAMGAQEILFGRDELAVASPLPDAPIMLGSVAALPHELLVAGVCVAAAAALALFAKSRWGRAFEAVSTDKDAAAMQGIPSHLIVAASYAISAALGGIAGWAVSPITGAGPTLEMLGVKGFCAAVVGSMSSAGGALASGLVIGMSESLAAYFIPSGYRALPALLMCALVLAFKPTGLFGKARNTKV
jgi:branched-chain amino acid transport system permease protein